MTFGAKSAIHVDTDILEDFNTPDLGKFLWFFLTTLLKVLTFMPWCLSLTFNRPSRTNKRVQKEVKEKGKSFERKKSRAQ